MLSGLILLSTACTGTTTGPPVARPLGTTPTPWPSASLVAMPVPDSVSTEKVCLAGAPEPTVTDSQDLPDAPRRADLLWYPGLNAGSAGVECRTWHTSVDGATAKALVADLKQLPAPTGTSACPSDDDSFIQVWFYTGQSAPSFRIGLQGCAFNFPSDRHDLGAWPQGMPPRPT